MHTYKQSLPSGYEVELLQNTAKELISEIWEEHCYSTEYKILPGDVVLDIGANQGIFSLYAAYRGATVYSFEPNKMNYDVLVKNIRNNGLSKQIFPFYGAVSSAEGEVTLFIPAQGEGVNPSTFATTSDTWIDSLASHNVKDVENFKVKAYALKDVLADIIQQKVAVMKIDTEGAEMDILSSADEQSLCNVDRMIMETHNAYEEKDLYELINKSGFSIISYFKLKGSFLTGYLYAEHNSICTKPKNEKPVAILTTPEKIILNQESVFSAEKSFSTVNTKNDLVCKFTIDNKISFRSENKMLKYCFETKGAHRVRLDVWDKDIDGRETDSSIDSAEKPVWVFSDNYKPGKDAKLLGEVKSAARVALEAVQNFIIPHTSFPKAWIFRSLVLCIDILDTSLPVKDLNINLICDGDRISINQLNEEIYFLDFPNYQDFLFSIETNHPFDCNIHWYVKEEAGRPADLMIHEAEDGCLHITESSLNHVCTVFGKHRFLIKKECFPKTWQIHTVNICVALNPDDTTGRKLEGNLSSEGKFFPLCEWYHKFQFPVDGKTDFEFEINVENKRIYQVSWWPE